MKINKAAGGILFIASTSIGVGMLAMPIVCGISGFFPSLILFVFCWSLALFSAFLLLKVALFFPSESNFITMTEETLGKIGKSICWVTYLLLFYSLVAAHIAAFSPMFIAGMQKYFGLAVPPFFAPIPFLLVFALFLFLGTFVMDLMNRFFIGGVLLSYLGLLFFLPSHVQKAFLSHIDFKPLLLSLPILVTSFGFHNIIPSLTSYLDRDEKSLKKVLVFGSLIPFSIYFVWNFLVLGSVPLEGIVAAWKKEETAIAPLLEYIQNPRIATFASSFALFAIIASFVGVVLGLSDFLADGFKIKKNAKGKILISLLMFLPPLVFIYLFPKSFILTLQYAGAFVAILLIAYPALMVWRLPSKNFFNSSFLGKCCLFFAIVSATLVVVLNLLDRIGVLQSLIATYL